MKVYQLLIEVIITMSFNWIVTLEHAIVCLINYKIMCKCMELSLCVIFQAVFFRQFESSYYMYQIVLFSNHHLVFWRLNFDVLFLSICDIDICIIIRLCDKSMQELTSSAGEDVVFAMNTFIKRLLSVSDPEQMKVWFHF